MSALRFAFSLLSCVFLAGQLSFISGQLYAAEKKPAKPKTQMPRSETGSKPCCAAGYQCPTAQTEGSTGCKCCHFRVDARLVDYQGMKKDSTLEVDGVPVTFVVTDHKVDAKLKDMGNGANGQFIMMHKEFENTQSPTGHGMRLECTDVGNTSIHARNKEFLAGADQTGKIYELLEALFNAIPSYPPELQEDK
jgi:hypothetical protein